MVVNSTLLFLQLELNFTATIPYLNIKIQLNPLPPKLMKPPQNPLTTHG